LLGEIRMFAGTFAPNGWALCNGQLLPIANNQALFSLLGTTYGGNGQTTFALPDLRGRVPMHAGDGPGLTPRVLGESGGAENHTLILPEIPTHSHQALADTGVGTTGDPGNALPARNAAGIPQYGTHANVALSPVSIAPAGGSQPHSIMQPYTTVTFIIALVGIYPSRP
jgi:microcystin-dependent protein